ncbi:MAG TPA: transcriptional regulator [Myxococcota bacterium]|jgi:predicted DNA-binding transcriptional regulator YafY|nr:transcriptional regulator [Myxococcota bacterium]HNH46951.1 transcriptional regulator [Myxococcota bacterium]
MDEKQLNKAQKFVRILELIQRPGGVAAQELIDRFEVDSRTLRRYFSDLKEMGVPLKEESSSGERLLAVDPTYARTGVHLTLAEVLSLHFGRTLFTFLDGTSFASEMDGAIERLTPAISRFTQDITRDLDRKFMAVGEHAKDYTGEGDLLDEIVSSLLYNNPADAEYRRIRSVSKFYRLEPLTLATYRQGLYLFARDVGEQKVKCFAVERFVRYSRLRRERFEYPESYDPHDETASAFGITGGPPEDVVAVFTPTVAPYVRERQWHRTQRLEIQDDGGIRLWLKVSVSPELKEWLLGFGPEAKVESPPSLVEWVRDAHRAALDRYK